MTAKAKPHGSLQVAQVAIGRLVPYARNARTHSDDQIDQIAASIREYGFTNPVLIDAKGGIIAGHGRTLAAQALGLAEVPCIVLAHLTAAQRRAYVIADNKLALNAGWDEELLRIELGELRDAGADLELTGFSEAELAALLGGPADPASNGAGSLAARFMLPPFSVFNAREGWWQDRKRAWLALGIKSELGRGGTGASTPPHGPSVTKNADGTLNYKGSKREDWDKPAPKSAKARARDASPGGIPRPAMDYSKRQRGNGAGRAL